MDLGHVSLRSDTSVEQGYRQKHPSSNGIELLMDASSSSAADKIRNSGSVVQSTEIPKKENGHSPLTGIENDLGSSVDEASKIDSVDKVTDHDGIKAADKNGSRVTVCVKSGKSLELELKLNGDGMEGEKAVALASSEGIGSPSVNCLASMEKSADDMLRAQTSSGSSININEVGSTGSSVQQRSETSARMRGEGIEIEKVVETPSKPSGASTSASGGRMPTTKGYGLKKWRRIKRDPGKDGVVEEDVNRNLKRGLSITDPVKSQDPSVDNRQKSEGSGSGSVASANSAMKNMVFSASIGGLNTEPRLAVGIALHAGTDTENSEDRSSKSTAASAPKLRLEMPLGAASTKEKSKAKNPGGRVSAISTHKTQHGKGKIETSKKLRGERIGVEKENSISSVESDLRSSSAAFMLASGYSGVGGGRLRESFLNYTGDNGDEVHVSEPQSSEEVQTDYYKENGEEIEVVSKDASADISGEDKKEETENQSPDIDQDPMVESIVLLQSAQTALEKEVREFGKFGKEFISVLNGSKHGVGASLNILFEETEELLSPPSDSRMIKLTQKMNHLEHELSATSVALRAKDSEVLALESILNKLQLPECARDKIVLQDQEVELDRLFKKRIEAEVEYLIMTRTPEKLRDTAENQISLFEEQKSKAQKQEQVLLKLREAEDKATMLRMQADEWESSCEKLLETAEILRMKSDVCKNSLCFLIQLVLLCIVLGLFLLQMLPHSTGFVPT